MRPSFHKVNKTVQGKKFNGIYYFGNDNRKNGTEGKVGKPVRASNIR